MDDISLGRRMAARHIVWGTVSLLAAGCALSIASVFSAASQGAGAIPDTVWRAHAWLTMFGWAVPVCLGLVGWLLPVLKDAPRTFRRLRRWSLRLLLVGLAILSASAVLEHLGRPAMFLLPLGWTLCLAAAAGYGVMIWHMSMRSLRPSAADGGIHAGVVWLLVIVAVRFVAAVGGLATNRPDFLASSEPGLLLAAGFGFMVNTGLGLAAVILPEFLRLPHARPQVASAFTTYNVVLAVIVVGFMWCSPFPLSRGGLPLIASALAFAYLIPHLAGRLQFTSLVFARSHSPRQLLARLALATALSCLVLAGLLVAVMAAWIAGLRSTPPVELLRLCLHLVTVGFFTNLVLALTVPLLGPNCLRGARGSLAYAAYGLTALWAMARLGLGVMATVRGQDYGFERGLVAAVAGLAALALATWLIGGFAALERRAKAS